MEQRIKGRGLHVEPLEVECVLMLLLLLMLKIVKIVRLLMLLMLLMMLIVMLLLRMFVAKLQLINRPACRPLTLLLRLRFGSKSSMQSLLAQRHQTLRGDKRR